MSFRINMARFTFFLSAASVAAAVYLVWSGIEFFHSEFPDVSVLKDQYPVVRYESPDEEPDVVIQKSRPASWASLVEISKVSVGAILVSEDWAFYQHKGYDANMIREAIRNDLSRGRFSHGASTITQQVVRNVFLEKDKNLWRKLRELYLALKLEESVSKNRILETYLNIAEWGEGIFGIRAAARHYFRKSPSELTAKEGAFLAMLLPSPKRYSASFRSRQLTDYARKTVNSILEKMARAHYLTETQRDLEALTPLVFEQISGNAM